jgi:hypothetical protein
VRPGCDNSQPKSCPLPKCPHASHPHLVCSVGCSARVLKNWAKLEGEVASFFFWSPSDGDLALVPHVCMKCKKLAAQHAARPNQGMAAAGIAAGDAARTVRRLMEGLVSLQAIKPVPIEAALSLLGGALSLVPEIDVEALTFVLEAALDGSSIEVLLPNPLLLGSRDATVVAAATLQERWRVASALPTGVYETLGLGAVPAPSRLVEWFARPESCRDHSVVTRRANVHPLSSYTRDTKGLSRGPRTSCNVRAPDGMEQSNGSALEGWSCAR